MLGNENIYMLTNADVYSLRVELEDLEGNKKFLQTPRTIESKCLEKTAPNVTKKNNLLKEKTKTKKKAEFK